MNKIMLICMMVFLPITLFSYEISFNKKFTKTVTPDLLKTFVTVSVEDEDETFINEKIEQFNKYIKKNNDVAKKNGSFTLSPKYTYYKNKQEFEGYVGRLRYEVKSVNAKDINKFIDGLISIKKKVNSRKVKLNISNITWITSQEIYKNSLDELRINAIVWIESYSNSLSKTLSKNCSVKSININAVNREFIRNEAVAYSAKSISSNVAPISSDKQININPNFILECK